MTLHSDSPVTPPDPLFMIWVAKTRRTQQPSWHPNHEPMRCPVRMGRDQAISIAQGIAALTINAARQYGLDNQLGSVQSGKIADLVILSDNLLAMEDDLDRLRTIRVLGTIHHGRFFANPTTGRSGRDEVLSRKQRRDCGVGTVRDQVFSVVR